MSHIVLNTNDITSDYDVEEYCPYCDYMVAIQIDDDCDDIEITCPICKRKLLLCSMCIHINSRCDWTEENSCCVKRGECKLYE